MFRRATDKIGRRYDLENDAVLTHATHLRPDSSTIPRKPSGEVRQRMKVPVSGMR